MHLNIENSILIPKLHAHYTNKYSNCKRNQQFCFLQNAIKKLICYISLIYFQSYSYQITYVPVTPWLMEPGGSMPQSQGLSNNSYPEPNQPNSPH